MSATETRGRYFDDGHPLTVYADLIYVVCPGSDGRAVSAPHPDLPAPHHYGQVIFRDRRLTCGACTPRGRTEGRRAPARTAFLVTAP